MDSELERSLRRQLPALRAFVRRQAAGVVRRKESTSDLVQSVCRELVQHAGSERFRFLSEPELRRWLQNAALYKIKNRHRYWTAGQRDAQRDVASPSPASTAHGVSGVARSGGTPSSQAALREEVTLLRGAFRELPPRYAEVIRYARLEGLCHEEIARRMDITERASRMLLSRALARLAVLSAWDRGEA